VLFLTLTHGDSLFAVGPGAGHVRALHDHNAQLSPLASWFPPHLHPSPNPTPHPLRKTTRSRRFALFYGLAILLGNLVLLAILGSFWLWEVYRPQNEYVFVRLPWWRYWPIPFLVLAFWFPYGVGLLPDFNPLLLLFSDFGVTFCATAPLIIALLTWMYPKVNRQLYTLTCFIGALIGVFNILAPFTMPGYTLWMLFLHTPLILISFYGLLLPRLLSRSETFA
jgi:hypothetical protein